jgi:selenocysteine-specific elongation factor
MSAGERGLTRADLAARTGWRDAVLDEAIDEAKRRDGETLDGGEAKMRGAVVEAEGLFLAREIFDRLVASAITEVEAHHRREPLQRGLARETLRERIFAHVAPELFRAALSEAERAGSLVAERDVVRAASHSLELSTEDSRLRERLEQIYRDAALELPTLEEAFARASEGRQLSRDHARKILQLLIDSGALARVSADLFIHRDALDSLVAALRDYAATRAKDRLIDVATFKEIAGVSRKYAIPLLEYLDRERVTRRAGDRRLVL